MKSVMISIKPKWCELIASGKKTVEVRKTRPKIETPFKCYIYETQGRYDDMKECKTFRFWESRQRVIGEFICENILSFDLIAPSKEFLEKQACLSYEEMLNYANGKPLYGWHISDLVIYDKPKELSEFRKIGALSYDEWLYGIYNGKEESNYDKYLMPFTMTRPPQSWGYCVLKNNPFCCII